MNANLKVFTKVLISLCILALVGCKPPMVTNIIVRPTSTFTKESPLTVVFDQSAEAQNLLELELMNYGFNIISKDVAKSVHREERKGQERVHGDQIVDNGREVIFKSEYVCKVHYTMSWGSSDGLSHNYMSVIRLSDGVILVSVDYPGNLDRAGEVHHLADLFNTAVVSKKSSSTSVSRYQFF